MKNRSVILNLKLKVKQNYTKTFAQTRPTFVLLPNFKVLSDENDRFVLVAFGIFNVIFAQIQ